MMHHHFCGSSLQAGIELSYKSEIRFPPVFTKTLKTGKIGCFWYKIQVLKFEGKN
jgi:hypothetical protein